MCNSTHNSSKPPWWNNTVSKSCWTPSDKSTSTKFDGISPNTWFSANIKGINLPVQNNTSTQTTKIITRTRKYKLRLSNAQRNLLRNWFGTVRWTYNKCVETAKNNELEKVTRTALRKLWVNRDALENTNNAWVLKTPYEIRSGAVIDFVKARAVEHSKKCKAAETNAKHANAEYKFRSLKDAQESISIAKQSWKNGVIYPTFWIGETGEKLGKLRGYSEKLPEILSHDFRLLRNNRNEYYLCVPMNIKTQQTTTVNNQNCTKLVAALDPGVRTFQTVYDPQRKRVISVGDADISRIMQISRRADKLQSRWHAEGVNAKKRYRMKKAAKRLHKHIQNKVKEVHCKLARFLCKEYDEILIPKFEVQKMVNKSMRKIGSKSARQMVTWSHYTFRQYLLNKAKEFGVKVHEVTEEYTSKTCGKCGELHQKLGGSKVFICPSCKYTADRDDNGARNILIRNYVLVSESLKATD